MTSKFDQDPDFDRSFWEAWPRWKFTNCWKPYHQTHAFSTFHIWYNKGGSMGICILNFSLEYNPYHKEA